MPVCGIDEAMPNLRTSENVPPQSTASYVLASRILILPDLWVADARFFAPLSYLGQARKLRKSGLRQK